MNLFAFTSLARLHATVEQLAAYNDKCRYQQAHSELQVKQERAEIRRKVDRLVARIGEASLPDEFIVALHQGEVDTDATGRYAQMLKRHFKRARQGI